MSDSKAVTMTLPSQLIIGVFCANIEPLSPRLYNGVRWIGWLAFAIHIITIGVSGLVTRVYTVALIVIPTILTVSKFACDDSTWMRKFRDIVGMERNYKTYIGSSTGVHSAPITATCYIGSRLKAEIYEWPLSYEPEFDEIEAKLKDGKKRTEKRQDLYAWLTLTYDEEQSMDKWDLFPHTRHDNNEWWDKCVEKASRIAEKAIEDVAMFKTESKNKLSIYDERNPRRATQAQQHLQRQDSPLSVAPSVSFPSRTTPTSPRQVLPVIETNVNPAFGINPAFPAGLPNSPASTLPRANTFPQESRDKKKSAQATITPARPTLVESEKSEQNAEGSVAGAMPSDKASFRKRESKRCR